MISLKALDKMMRPGATLPDEFVSTLRELQTPQRIFRLGGDLISYRPLSEFDTPLYPIFVRDASSSNGVLDFVEKFGPLTHAGLAPDQGDDVGTALKHSEAMRALLELEARGKRARVANYLRTRGIPLGALDAALIFDRAIGATRLSLTPKDLLTAMWIQLGQALASGAVLRQCRHCGNFFDSGPGTVRRLDAKFCSDQHRIAFNSLKRTKEK